MSRGAKLCAPRLEVKTQAHDQTKAIGHCKEVDCGFCVGFHVVVLSVLLRLSYAAEAGLKNQRPLESQATHLQLMTHAQALAS